MKICFVGPVPPIKGGIAQHSKELVLAMREMGHDVVVLSWKRQYPSFLYPGEELDPHAQPFAGARFGLRWWNPLSWLGAARVARTCDLLVFPWVTPVQAIPLEVIVRASRVPAVAIVHNPLPHERRFFDEPLTKRVLARARGAIVHAELARAELHALAPNLRARVVAMPPLLRVHPSPLPPSPPFRLLYVGIVRPYKGLDVALSTMRVLRERGRDVRLTIAGEFWEPVQEWRARIAREGIADVVDVRAGYVPDDAMQELFDEHHLVIAPYRSATQSAIVPVANAAARPVAATRVGGLAECVVDGKTGTLAAPEDPQDLADAVDRALASLDVLSAGALAAQPTWRDVVDAVLDVAQR
jgi:glycosyltransferase involved in cell wall biosynthesis